MNGHWNGASCDCYSGFGNSNDDHYTCVKSSTETPHCVNGHWNGEKCHCYAGFVNSNDDHYVCIKSTNETPHCINGHWNGESCDCYPGFEKFHGDGVSQKTSHGDAYLCVKSDDVGPITECSLSCNNGQCNIDNMGKPYCVCSAGYTGLTFNFT